MSRAFVLALVRPPSLNHLRIQGDLIITSLVFSSTYYDFDGLSVVVLASSLNVSSSVFPSKSGAILGVNDQPVFLLMREKTMTYFFSIFLCINTANKYRAKTRI